MSHAIRRAHERYGLALTEKDLRTMQAMFLRRDPAVLIIQRQPAGRCCIVIAWCGQHLHAVVSDVGVVMTFLPYSEAVRPAPRQPCRKRRNGAKFFRDSGIRGGRTGRGRRPKADEMVESGE